MFHQTSCQFRDLSKIQSGSVKVNQKMLNLKGCINEAFFIFKERAASKNLNYELEISANCPVNIYSDEIAIRQILTNLISNAVKFTESGFVKVLIDGKYINTEEYNLRIYVKDSGIGMSSDVLTKIFEPFNQSDNPVNLKYYGTGLGLSIVKGLVDLLNGTIEVKSEVNKGTVFLITIDNLKVDGTINIEEKRPNSLTLTNDINCILEGKNILIVDDEKVNITILSKFLMPYKVNIFQASNGMEAFNIFRDNCIDFIVIDYSMPEMNGVETICKIKDELKSDFNNVLISTGYLDKQNIEGLDGTEYEIINKPISKKLLIDKIYSIMNNNCIIVNNNPLNDTGTVKENKSDTDKSFHIKLREYLINDYETAFATLNIDDIQNLINKGMIFAENNGDNNSNLNKCLDDLQLSINDFNVSEIFSAMQKFKTILYF